MNMSMNEVLTVYARLVQAVNQGVLLTVSNRWRHPLKKSF